MPLSYRDRVKQAVSSGGTGSLTLGAAASGYQAFAAGDDAKLFPYVIEDGTAWETGYGTYTHSGTAFARTNRFASSTGSALNVTTSAYVFVDVTADMASGFDVAAQGITPGGRLTLESGVPVSTSDQTAKTTIYYTPCVHNSIVLWDGNRWTPVNFAEVSLALGTITSAKPYDVFGYLSSGALVLELLAWTSDTARATAVTLQDGRYCKSGDKTRLLLGSFYTTATTTTEDSDAKRLLWNMYNRTLRRSYKYIANNHIYNAATWRQWDNNTANQVAVMVGLHASANYQIWGSGNSSGSGNIWTIGFALDSTSTALDGSTANWPYNSPYGYGVSAGVGITMTAGYHYISANEYSNATSNNNFASYSLSGAVLI